MSLLLGLPLRLLALLFTILRFLLPVLLVLLALWLLRRSAASAYRRKEADPDPPPQFDGPVYTVDYEEVDEDKDSEG